jgi:hypothetical protein
VSGLFAAKKVPTTADVRINRFIDPSKFGADLFDWGSRPRHTFTYAGSIKVFSNIARMAGREIQNLRKGTRRQPSWTPDGKQIVFASGQRLMSVDVQTTPSFAFSESKALPIEIENTQGRPYDITRDSKQFLVMQRPDESATPEKTSPQINVVLNWFREIQERVPVR